MQVAEFVARCDLELGDKVELNNSKGVWFIEEIAAIHYVSTGKVEFKFLVRNPGLPLVWVSRDQIKRRIKDEKLSEQS
jgi:hypothetical protein